jgi:hypothetical protein
MTCPKLESAGIINIYSSPIRYLFRTTSQNFKKNISLIDIGHTLTNGEKTVILNSPLLFNYKNINNLI